MGVFANLSFTLSRSACRATPALMPLLIAGPSPNRSHLSVLLHTSFFKIESMTNTQLCYEEAV
jgi:hypothetical protein